MFDIKNEERTAGSRWFIPPLPLTMMIHSVITDGVQ